MVIDGRAGNRSRHPWGGAAVACLGRGHPDVMRAMHAQIAAISYAHTGFFTTAAAEELADHLVYRPRPSRRAYRVFRTERGFRVTGRPPEEAELEAVLRAAGAREGDEVEIGDEVLEWE